MTDKTDALVEQLAEAIGLSDRTGWIDSQDAHVAARAVLPVVAAQVEAAVSVVRAQAKERGALVASERAHSSALRHRAESAEADLRALREKVARVEAIHFAAGPHGNWCGGCHDGSRLDVWPCATIAALSDPTTPDQ